MKTVLVLLLALSLSGCALTDAWGITHECVEVVASREIDQNNDGVVDAREITERVSHQIRPEIVATAQQVARSSAPGPWGEIAAAGVGLLAAALGVSSYRRRRVVSA